MLPELVCPLDHQSLARAHDALACAAGHAFPVEAGIPRTVTRSRDYADAFGLQWKTYRTTQLDSRTGVPLSRNRARRCLGEAAWQRLHAGPPASVLEVGCGAGRFTEVLLELPNAYVTSIDYSDAAEANQETCPASERHQIIQADVMKLPFAPGQFDIVFCLGVIQHTPSPEATIAKLYDQVKPGGLLVFDHYTYTLARIKAAWLYREVLRRMPREKGLKATEMLVRAFLPLHRAVRRVYPLQAILSRVSPLQTYYHAYPQLGDELQAEWAFLDTHDTLTDWYKHLRTKGQIERTLKALGADEIVLSRGGNGIEARCRRPLPQA